MSNTNLILVCGPSGSGKSMSLRNLRNPERVRYLNCENNKRLPFKTKFDQYTVTDPYQVWEAIEQAEEENSNVDTIVIDSATFLMDMFESTFIYESADSRSAWQDYAQFFKILMNKYVNNSTKNIIFLAHTVNVVNEDKISETLVPIKGSLKNNGIEAFFSTIVSCKKLDIEVLKDSDVLTITKKEKEKGWKHVFQLDCTRETRHERMRAPITMWEDSELYADNDVQIILDRLTKFYSDES